MCIHAYIMLLSPLMLAFAWFYLNAEDKFLSFFSFKAADQSCSSYNDISTSIVTSHVAVRLHRKVFNIKRSWVYVITYREQRFI